MRHYKTLFATILMAAPLLAAPASAQVSEMMRFDIEPYFASSGVHHGPQAREIEEGERPEKTRAFVTVVRSPNVNLTRVHFEDFHLGENSRIHITSLKDGAVQYFSHEMLVEWDGWSAIFNGDTVVVELFVAAGDEDVFFEISEISVNDPFIDAGVPPDGGVATLCFGTDSRVSSVDTRVGRLSSAGCGTGGSCGGCSAWLSSVGSAVTAGHCGNGQGGVIEFNVPQSTSNGTPTAAHPNNQYPVGVTWYAFQNGGVGFDWAIMSVGPNANTGLRAHWAQNHFHLSPILPADGITLRITGYGVDNVPTGTSPFVCCASSGGNCTHWGCNSNSLTQQFSTGPKTNHTDNRFFYQSDTEPANSGSPIIRHTNGFAIGVHTHGGCHSDGGANSGTRITQSTFGAWFDNFLNNATFVDWPNVSIFNLGTALNPASNVPQGIALAPVGGTVAIAGGIYPAANNTGTFNKAVTLRAVSGPVTIGF